MCIAELADTVSPAKAPRPDGEPISERSPSEPSDGSNSFLQGYPAPDGRFTTSTQTPDVTTPESAPEARSSSNVPIGSASAPLGSSIARPAGPAARSPNATEALSNLRTRTFAPRAEGSVRSTPGRPFTPSAIRRVRRQAAEAIETSDAKILAHQPRRWQLGEVYAPHDLSSAEAQKNARARSAASARFNRPPNRNGSDMLDAMRLDPRSLYANMTVMSELVSDMGRIKSRALTGFRLKNQRRAAKAVRRAIGMGLVPSVHKHPELFSERADQMGKASSVIGSGRY